MASLASAKPFDGQSRTVSHMEFAQEALLHDLTAQRKAVYDENNSVCKHFLRGRCRDGDQCKFKHSRSQRTVTCKHWLRGLCKLGDHCQFLHVYDMEMMPICHFFVNFGQCASGDECQFRHIEAQDRIHDCMWYARGFCKHGANCRGRHRRQEACADYLAGFCPKGPDCEKGHPKFEMPAFDTHGPGKGVARPPMMCTICMKDGHTASHCHQNPDSVKNRGGGGFGSRPPQRDLSTVKCYNCQRMGHYASSCPEPQQSSRSHDSHSRPHSSSSYTRR